MRVFLDEKEAVTSSDSEPLESEVSKEKEEDATPLRDSPFEPLTEGPLNEDGGAMIQQPEEPHCLE
jgi:hypothetical protein